tara:strand:- start:210 stop:461 length:252 start_codon:yes stop_codon:yes gene_type:complete
MIILMISFFYLIDYIMDRTPATQNQKLLMDIQYQIKELNSLIVGLKYEICYIKSNLHYKPDVIKQDIVIIEDEEPIKSWFWNS